MYRGNLSFLAVAFFLTTSGLTRPSLADSQESVTLEGAWQRALRDNPTLQVFESKAEVADGLIEQAGLKPNPSLSTEFEDFLGSGPFNGVDSLEITVGLNQLIERGNKRTRRAQLAESQKELIGWDLALYKAELRYVVHRTFTDVLIGQESVELNRELVQLAQDSFDAINRLVDSARASRVEASRARLAFQQQEFELQRAEYTLGKARAELAALWGLSKPPEFEAIGEITLKGSLPSLESMMALIDQSPDLARYEAEIRARESALELEKAQAKQDISAFAAVRGFNEGNDAALVAGFEIPLPFRDRNQGNIRAALAQVRQTAAKEDAQRRDLSRVLVGTYQDLARAYVEARTLKVELLPSAETTQAETEAGYQRGQFTLVTVLESRRTLFEIRNQYLDALERYQQALVTIERLTLPVQISHEYYSKNPRKFP